MRETMTKEELQAKIIELEAKLSDNEKAEFKSRSWLENSPVCTKIIDLDFNLQYMSTAGMKALQLEDVSAYYGKPYPFSFFPEAYNKVMRENLLIAKEKGETRIQDGEIQDIKGNALWFQATITPVYDNKGKLIHIMVVSIDISDRIDALNALKENELLQKQTQAISNVGGWSYNVLSGESKFTEQAFLIFGLPIGEIVSIRDGINFYDPADRIIISQAFSRAIVEGKAYDLEAKINNAQGKKVFVRTTGAPIVENGKVVKVNGAIFDITERKKAETELKESEEKFRKLFQNTALPLCFVDKNGVIKIRNERFIQAFGYDEKEVPTLKEWWLKAYPDPEYRAWVVQNWETAVEEAAKTSKDIKSDEYLVTCKDGRIRNIIISGSTLDDNFIATFVDITERKKAEEEILKAKEKAESSEVQLRFLNQQLKANEEELLASNQQLLENEFELLTSKESAEETNEQLDMALHGAGAGLWSWNIKTGEDILDERWCGILGYKQEEIEQVVESWERLLHPDDKESIFELVNKHLEDENNLYDQEYRMKCKNGEWKWIHALGKVVERDLEGEPVRMSGIIIDINERKRTEIELLEAKEKAEESDRLKSAFLANMSHEIRTPMNGILGFINMLNEPDLSKDEIEEYSAVINRGGKRLLTTINDIIDISRIESGEVAVSRKETSIDAMMDELYSFYLPEMEQKGLDFIVKLNMESLYLHTDSHKLHGIMTNLIKNAIKFTDQGSITFGYDYNKATDKVMFFVEDTGIGIPSDRLQAIFMRFEQADNEDKRAFDGSGLGLAISKAFVEMLGGEIIVESEYGKGSKFSFSIPCFVP